MANPYAPITYKNNVGGVNLISGAPKVRDFEWEDALNVDIDTDGSTKSREGTTLVAKSVVYSPGLMAYWKLEEATGDREDEFFVGWDFTPVGAPGNAAGIDGNALTASSGNHLKQLNTVSDGDLSGAGSFSAAFWFRTELAGAAGTNNGFVMENRNGAAQEGWQIEIEADGVTFRVRNQGLTLQSISGSDNVSDDAYHSVVCVKTEGGAGAGKLEVFIDGVLSGTSGLADNIWTRFTADSFFVGASRAGVTTLDHRVDSLQYWRKALTLADAVTFHNAGVAGGADLLALVLPASMNFLGLFQFKPVTGVFEELGIAGGTLVRYEASIPAFVHLRLPSNVPAAGLSLSARHSFVQLFDRVYFGNGVDANLRYDDGVIYTQGLTDGGTSVIGTPTFVAGGDIDNDTDIYFYKIVPVRISGGGRTIVGRPAILESPTAGIGHVLDSGNDTIQIASFPAALERQQTHWGLYRNRSSATTDPRPDSSFAFVDDVPIGTINFNDTNQQIILEQTLDNIGIYFQHRKTPPVQLRTVSTVASANTILQSGDPLEPESLYPSASDFPDMHLANKVNVVGRDDGDPVTGLATFYDNFIIFKEDRYWLAVPFFDDSQFPYRIVEGNRDIGCVSHWSIANLPDRLIWKADRGFFEMRGVFGLGTQRVTNVSRRIEPDLTNWNGARRAHIVGVHFRRPEKGAYRVAITPTGETRNTRTWVYDYDHRTRDPENARDMVGAWMPWEGFTAETMWSMENVLTGVEEIWVGTNQGEVLLMDSGLNDYDPNDATGKAIHSFLLTKHYDHKTGNHSKRWRELELEGNTVGGPLAVGWNLDYGQRIGSVALFDMQLASGGCVFGTDDWGASDWGGLRSAQLLTLRNRLHKATGHHIQLEFSNEQKDTSWLLSAWTLRAIRIASLRHSRTSV